MSVLTYTSLALGAAAVMTMQVGNCGTETDINGSHYLASNARKKLLPVNGHVLAICYGISVPFTGTQV